MVVYFIVLYGVVFLSGSIFCESHDQPPPLAVIKAAQLSTIIFASAALMQAIALVTEHSISTSLITLRRSGVQHLDLLIIFIAGFSNWIISMGLSPSTTNVFGMTVYIARWASYTTTCGMMVYLLEANTFNVKASRRAVMQPASIFIGMLGNLATTWPVAVTLMLLATFMLFTTTVQMVLQAKTTLECADKERDRQTTLRRRMMTPMEKAVVDKRRRPNYILVVVCILFWTGYIVVYGLYLTGLVSEVSHFVLTSVVEIGNNIIHRQALYTAQNEATTMTHAIHVKQRTSALIRYIFHEVRVPLNTIKLSLDKLRYHDLHADEDMMEQMTDAVQIMDSTLNATLALEKTNATTVHIHDLDLEKLIRSSVGLFHSALTARNCTVVLHVGGSVPKRIHSNEEYLSTIVRNYLSNVSKYCTPGTPVRIIVEQTDDIFELRICNHGAPISTEDLTHVFEPFSQIRSADKQTDLSSTGLGLGICRAMAEAMHGTTGATCDDDGIITFFLRHPVPPTTMSDVVFTTDVIQLVPHTTRRRRRRRRLSTKMLLSQRDAFNVLIVDDMKTNRDLTAFLVQKRLGVRTSTAESGQECLAMLREPSSNFTTVLLDNIMPGISGVDVAREIQKDETLSDITIIGVTGNALPEDIAEFVHAGACSVLTKPLDLDMLVTLLERSQDISI